MELRGYQKQMIAEIENAFLIGKNSVLAVAPTGSGKTVIFSQIVKDAIAQNLTCMVVVHRPSTLIGQAVDKLKGLGVSPSLICAGSAVEPDQSVYIASLQTLSNRQIPQVDLVIFDEAHTTSFYKASDRIFAELPNAKFLGFTATPWRLKKTESLADRFDHVVRSPGYQHMIMKGYLVAPRYFAYRGNDRLDLSGVKTAMGEYTVKGLDVVCNTPRMVQRTVEEFKRICGDRPSICFAVSVAHAESLCEAFKGDGFPAEVITGKTPLDERLQIFERFESGETQVLISVEVLTEGYDSPKASCVIMARPTLSKGLYVQMVGRGLRPWEGKTDCIIIDIADNALTHGLITHIDSWDTCEHGRSKAGDAPVKQCPDCGMIVSSGFAECPECGYIFREDLDDDFDIGQTLEEVDPAFLAVAQWRESLAWEKKAFNVLTRIQDSHPSYRWLYLSFSSDPVPLSQLGSTIAAASKSFQRMTQRNSWPATGWIKTVEITPSRQLSSGKWTNHRARVFVNCLLMVRPGYFSKNYISKPEWQKIWADVSMKGCNAVTVESQTVKIGENIKPYLSNLFRQRSNGLTIEKFTEWSSLASKQTKKRGRVSSGGILKGVIRWNP